MLTQKRIILILPEGLEKLLPEIRYEAIEPLAGGNAILNNYGAAIFDVWARNKVPMLKESEVDYDVLLWFFKPEQIVRIPDPYPGRDGIIEFCHANGVECGEYQEHKQYDTALDECFLCRIAGREGYKTTAEFNSKTPIFHDLVIMESPNFDVKVELGAIVPGMLMISPKAHILSAAQIPNYQRQEYYDLMHDVEYLLKGVFGDGPVVFFEHGSAPSGLSSHKRSIVHAHVHVVWGYEFPQEYLEAVQLEPMSLDELSTSKYLSYQLGADGKLLAVNNPRVYVQRQYPRQVIGELAGVPNDRTNWRHEGFDENMWITFEMWYAFLKEHWNELPARIQRATRGYIDGYARRRDRPDHLRNSV